MGTPITVISKKKQGVFYTPRYVAEILCDWAISARSDVVLEPSFGGCDFLEAARSKLGQLGATEEKIKLQLFGSDIDPQAFTHLGKIVSNPNGHFLERDFLKITPDSFPAGPRFNVVVGNPPYVSHHNMVDEQMQSAIQALKANNIDLDGRASLWAYFVLHSLQFLKTDGRMAWILPSSFLYVDYSRSVRRTIINNFRRTLVIHLGERLFVRDGTEEISVITLCDGYQPSRNQSGTFEVIYAPSVGEIQKRIESWAGGGSPNIRSDINSTLALLSDDAFQVFNSLVCAPGSKTLGEFCLIKIGIVSGANSFFFLNKSHWNKYGLTEDVLSFVLTRFRFSKGIQLLEKDLQEIISLDYPCILFDTSNLKVIDGPTKNYLDTFPTEKRNNITTFVRRSCSRAWHTFNDHRIPDAFFPYMHNDGPSLIMNYAKINSTNSIHRLYFKSDIHECIRKAIAISILSTFSQLSAEIEGRTYGAGVLKHEPSEAARIRLLLPTTLDEEIVNTVFQEIDQYIRQGEKDKARKLADIFIIQDFEPGVSERYQTVLAKALECTRAQRFPIKKAIRG